MNIVSETTITIFSQQLVDQLDGSCLVSALVTITKKHFSPRYNWNSWKLKPHLKHIPLQDVFECYYVRLNHSDAVSRTTTRRQRSRSLAGSLSRSADWTEELERRLRSREEERTLDSGGSGEYLMGYKGGSQPICTTRRSSCGQISTCGFQDIFSGQEEKYTIVNILSCKTVKTVKQIHLLL